MAQDYLNLETTPTGLNMIARSMYGDSITFTKIKLGNGVQTGTPSDMINPLATVSISKIEKAEGRVVLTGYLTSSGIETSFYGTELGVYAKADDETEVLFAYRCNQTDVDYYPATSSGRAIELTFSVVIQIGAAENVTAILIEGDAYAKKSDFDDHVADYDNPHKVTKEQLGLENVENKAIDDQEPTFTEASAASELVSGETLSTSLGKIAAAVKSLLNHIADKNNPHGITAEGISAASINHVHAASDINSGTLSVLRGGTGASKLQDSDVARVRKATLSSSGWTTSVPYTQSITVSGIDDTMAPVIALGVPSTKSAAGYTAAKTAYALIDGATTGAGVITFECYLGKPTADIPLLIKGV